MGHKKAASHPVTPLCCLSGLRLAEYVEYHSQQGDGTDERAEYTIGGFRSGSDDKHDHFPSAKINTTRNVFHSVGQYVADLVEIH